MNNIQTKEYIPDISTLPIREKVILILSGGMDSTTLLYELKHRGYDIHVLSFDYGQRHRRELECASRITSINNLPHKIIDIKSVSQVLEGSSLTRSTIVVPKGHYTEPSMKVTVVPNRNMIMLSIATAWAVSIGATKVFYAAHAGDHAIYPDCREEFVSKMSQVTRIANYHPVDIEAPYLELDKGDIVKRGLTFNVPYKLTHTCYEGTNTACGKCGACVERLEAFSKAGITDPIVYASTD